MEGTMSEIRWFSGDFQPKNWAYCMGQLLPINQNQALFSLLGTTYGGNGMTTFGLPDFRSRTAVGTGNNTMGVQQYQLGEMSGVPNKTLTLANLPAHNHVGSGQIKIPVNSEGGSFDTPSGRYLSPVTGLYIEKSKVDTTMAQQGGPIVVTDAGSSQPLNIEQPYLAINYIICLYGIYPSRN